jgi:hypothetical protein
MSIKLLFLFNWEKFYNKKEIAKEEKTCRTDGEKMKKNISILQKLKIEAFL